MRKNIKKVLIAAFTVLAMSGLAACGFIGGDTSSSSDAPVSNESVESVESVESTCEHVYADEYTCHDRECTECGETKDTVSYREDHFGYYCDECFAALPEVEAPEVTE